MKTQLAIKIPKSCSEKWSSFTPKPSEGGRFCQSCSKVVIDFTRMSDEQVLDFFSNVHDHTCGRFRPDQLKTYAHLQHATIRPGFTLLKAGLLSLAMTFISKPSSATILAENPKSEISAYQSQHVQTSISSESDYTVRGFVTSEEDGSALPGVNVYLKCSSHGTVTDTEGNFEFPIKLKAGDVLVFSFIGLVTQEYKVPSEIRAVIEMRMSLYYELMGEVALNDVYAEHTSLLQGWWKKVKELF
ncbi:MAG: carboxypeptidase-like regulatory domain-containing protein [Chryseolinea sp.]